MEERDHDGKRGDVCVCLGADWRKLEKFIILGIAETEQHENRKNSNSTKQENNDKLCARR